MGKLKIRDFTDLEMAVNFEKKSRGLEGFMEKVAKIANCLPDYTDPSNDNNHILEKLESQLTWKNPEVDGLPEKGVYLCKIDMGDFGWVYKTANVVKGEFRLCHDFTVVKPNYYRLIEEG